MARKYNGKGKRGMRKGKSRVISKAVAAAKEKIFAKRVQKVISKKAETKTCMYSSNVTAFNQQINATGDCLRLFPIIANGTSEATRVGNAIRLQSLNLRGVLTFTLAQASASNTRIGVRLMILRAKRFEDWNQSAADFATNYTRLLEGTTTGFDGTLAAFNTPVNNDYFSVVLDKKMYMSQSLISANAALANSTGVVGNTTKFVNINIPYARRNVQYDQDFSATEPVNYPYFMVLGYTKLSGDVPDAPGTVYLSFQYTTQAKYEDY